MSQMLSQKLKPTLEDNPVRRSYQKIKYFLMDNWQRVWVMMLWLGIMLGLFAYKFVQYRNKAAFEVMGYCVCVAKGGAETLKFNMALILLPVCRNTITWLRNKTKLGTVVPFDDNLNFHKVYNMIYRKCLQSFVWLIFNCQNKVLSISSISWLLTFYFSDVHIVLLWLWIHFKWRGSFLS